MKPKMKNVKISEEHHNILKFYCDNRGLKIHRVLEKWIDENCKLVKRNKDIYDE